MNEIPFTGGYHVGREALHDWTQHLTVTRERGDDGDEFCICWVGAFSLITTDGGGWFPDEGAALGVLPDGTTVLDTDWRSRLGESAEETEQAVPRFPLAQALTLAHYLANAATGWIPAVDASFAAGDTLADLEAASNELLSSAMRDDFQASILGMALVMLWLSEESRRNGAQT
jgi:hypothetical protein